MRHLKCVADRLIDVVKVMDYDYAPKENNFGIRSDEELLAAVKNER